MSFQIPSLKDLLERTRKSMRAHLPGTDAWIWPNNLAVIAKVFAGAIYEIFAFAEYVQRQMFAATADGDSLIRHGNEYGMPKLPARPARGQIKLTSVGAMMVVVGAEFDRSDGVRIRSLVTASRDTSGDMLIDAAAVDSGKIGTTEASTSLIIVSGVTGDNVLAEVGPDGIVGGAEIEDDESYRARILFRKRNPPHGGAAADYVDWASKVSGVSRVYVERLWAGVGTVRVFPLMDGLYANGIPPAGEIARVADYIEMVRPAGALVTVEAASAVPINITIDGLSPNTTAVREAVLAELRETFRTISRVAGGDTPHGGMPFLATATSFSRSWIWQAVANATGEERHTIVAPAADVALVSGEMATLGTVTFT